MALVLSPHAHPHHVLLLQIKLTNNLYLMLIFFHSPNYAFKEILIQILGLAPKLDGVIILKGQCYTYLITQG